MSKDNRVTLKCKSCNGTMEVDSKKEVLKCPYCGSSDLLIDSDEVKIQKIKFETIKDILVAKENRIEKKEEIEKFKKSFFSKVLLIFAIFTFALTFIRNFNFASIICFIQSILFIVSWLMGMKIIKEKFNGLYIILAIISFALIVPFFKFSVTKEKPVSINFSEFILEDKLPEYKNAKGKVYSNSRDVLMIDIYEVKPKDFENYVNEVIDFGYDLDLEYEDWDSFYGAFNEDGYSIRISYSDYDSEMSITLNVPKKLEKIEWPDKGLAKLLPKPKSDIGSIYSNSSDSLILYIGKMTISDYNDYVKECEDKGFVDDFTKEKKYYSAKNKAGYELTVSYRGGEVIEISLELGDEEESIITTTKTTKTTKTTTTKKTTKKNDSVAGMRKEFKQAMDDYEDYIDEYVAFMKKFNKSNGNDISLLKDYASYVSSYAKMVDSFEKWEDEDLSDKELDYYIKVQTRVNKKLLEI